MFEDQGETDKRAIFQPDLFTVETITINLSSVTVNKLC
jgi:hypothetical protein